MNKGVVAFFAFAFGGVTGFFAGKKMLEQHFRQIVDEEIDSVKQAFRNYAKGGEYSCNAENKEHSSGQRTKAAPRDYRVYYNKDDDAQRSEVRLDERQKPQIRVIAPDEFDSEGYETVSLKYYADGVVADETGEAMTEREIEESITRESLNHFGEYEHDSVYVRNDIMQIDYEILLDDSKFGDRS